MDRGERSWFLHDKQQVLVYAALALATAYACWRLYQKRQATIRRARRIRLVEAAKREKERIESKQNVVVVETASGTTKSMHELSTVAVEPKETDTQRPEPAKADSLNQPKRSKERRKRGRDVFKDLSKQEKKLKTGKPSTSQGAQSHRVPRSSVSTGGSTRSRSSSTTGLQDDYDSNVVTPRASDAAYFPSFSSEDGNHDDPKHIEAQVPASPAPERSVTQEIPIVSPTPQVVTTADTVPTLEQYPLSPRRSRSQREQLSPPPENIVNGGPSHSSSPTSSRPSSPAGSSSNVPPTTVDVAAPQPFPPPTLPQPVASGSGTSKPAWLETYHTSGSSESQQGSPLPTHDNWDRDPTTQLSPTYRRSPPPRFRSRSRASVSPLPMPSSSMVECPSLMFASLNSTPPPNASFSTQIASYKGAMEAARLREEKLRSELDRCSKEVDVLRWRWNEDAALWKRRETELQSHIHQLMHQVHALSAPASHLQPFVNQQPQHSPHGHATFPLLPNLPLGSPFGFPSPIGPQHPHPPGMSNMQYAPYLSPLPTGSFGPPSGAQSPSREGRPNGNGKHKMGKARMGSSGSNGSGPMPTHRLSEDDVPLYDAGHGGGFSDGLAEAILKRPDSIRSPSSASASSGGASRSASVLGRAGKNGFTFPSLSELGNPQRAVGDVDETPPNGVHDEHDQCDGDAGNEGGNGGAIEGDHEDEGAAVEANNDGTETANTQDPDSSQDLKTPGKRTPRAADVISQESTTQ